jgi:DNA polymerase-3 subunit alpha
MNALYRPGPLEYIPSFVDRKNGKEEISYDLPEMEEYLRRNLWDYSLSRASYVACLKS